jgi:hypothetical protein
VGTVCLSAQKLRYGETCSRSVCFVFIAVDCALKVVSSLVTAFVETNAVHVFTTSSSKIDFNSSLICLTGSFFRI